MTHLQEETDQRKIVTPLRRLLAETPFDQIISFLHQTRLQWYLVRKKSGGYKATIWMEGMVKYQAGSSKSARIALCDALSRFLTCEHADYHDYCWTEPIPKTTVTPRH